MTPSLARMEEGKPAGAGRCCLLTDFPLRQPRRISNLPAGVHSACPNTSSIGPAAFPYIGRRADPLHPGLVSIPGSQSVLEPPVAASLVAADLPTGQPGGDVLGRRHPFYPSLTNRLQPASDPVREGTQGGPGVGLLHVHNMRESHAESVASAYVNPRR